MAMVYPLTLFSFILISILVSLPINASAQGLIRIPDNSSACARPTWIIPPSVLNKGILVRPIRSISILNSSPGSNPANRRIPNLMQVSVAGNKWTVVNGTFSYWPIFKGRKTPFPMGMVIRNDIVEANEACGLNSGAIVIRGSQITIARSGAANLNQAHARFGSGINGFMGCGVLLIEDGRKVDSNDLKSRQGFSFDLDNDACRSSRHTLIGIRKGEAYVIFNPENDPRKWLSCRQYRDLFHANGFGALVKFDGSSGFFYKDSAASEGNWRYNPTGFLIQEW